MGRWVLLRSMATFRELLGKSHVLLFKGFMVQDLRVEDSELRDVIRHPGAWSKAPQKE